MFKSQARSILLLFQFVSLLLMVACLGSPVDITIGREYHGEYISQYAGKSYDYLENRMGEITVLFYGSPNHGTVNSVEILLLDPEYRDQRTVLVDIKGIVEVDHQSGVWQSSNHSITFNKKWKDRNIDYASDDHVSTVLILENLDSEDYEEVSITLKMKGKTFDFTAELKFHNQIISTMWYSIYVTAVIAIQIFSAFALLKLIDGPNFAAGVKFSILSLCLCNIEDFAQTMSHIEYLMSSPSGYLLFILPALSYLTLFVAFEMKMLFLVWKSHNIEHLENTQQLRKKLTAFYVQFYLGLFAFLTLNYFFANQEWMIILRNLILLPQIIHNIRLGQKPTFNPYYIFGFMGSRLLVPIYQRACSENRFKLAPNTTLVFVLLSIYVMEILLVALQNRLGSRFFVPKRFLPDYFEYRHKMKISEENRGDECAICLQNLFQKQTKQAASIVSINQQILQQQLLEEVTIMKTPCNHKFHEQCLGQWIAVKLECPSCRTALPHFDH